MQPLLPASPGSIDCAQIFPQGFTNKTSFSQCLLSEGFSFPVFYGKTSAGEDGEVKNEPELTGAGGRGQLEIQVLFRENSLHFSPAPLPQYP